MSPGADDPVAFPPSQALSVRQEQPVALPQAPPIADMLQAVIQKGVTGENVKAVEAIVGLYERVQALDAKKAYTQAFNALQKDLPKVKARKAVPDKNQNIKYRFAPYEEIMDQVAPLLEKHGFTVSFDTTYEGTRLVKHCKLTHIGGHSETNSFGVNVGQGPPGASITQADGAAGTYAKRFALCDMLNITIEQDTDGDPRAEGDTITKAQAEDLRKRVRETGSDEARFLKYAGAASFEEIKQGKLSMLDDNLRRKESTR